MNVINGTRRNASTFCENYNKFSVPGSLIDEDTPSLPFLNWIFPIVLVSFFGSFFRFALEPFGQAAPVAQMLAGILLGPSFISRSEKFRNQMFSAKITTMLNLSDVLGVIYMSFTISARTDINIIKQCGRMAIAIGIGSFVIPLLANLFVTELLRHVMQLDLDEQLSNTLPVVATMESGISFHVVFSILSELKLLNSELGRLALSSSLISSMLGVANLVLFQVRTGGKRAVRHGSLYKYLSFMALLIIIVFALRPMLLWMMKQTPEGKLLKPVHVLAINFMVLGCALFGDSTGLTTFVGPLLLGTAIPVSPPMGSRLTNKLDYFVWAVFMPCFMVNLGREINLFSLKLHAVFAVGLMVLVGIVTKSFSILVTSLYFGVPLVDSISLAMILNCRGLYDVQLLSHVNWNKVITPDCFTIMVMTAIFRSLIFIPGVKSLYDSSRRYVAYRNLTLQHCGRHPELRVLACIHEPHNVTTIINILEASNPPVSPLGIYVMKLEEYTGTYIPIVIPHRLDQIASSGQYTKVRPMIEAFQHFQEKSMGNISVQCFTAIAPYVTMHDDICLMAFEKSVSLVIIPFPKKKAYFTKIVIQNVLKMSPCSVGIFFERGIFRDPKSIFSRQRTLNVCVICLGGSDDFEALAYGVRMAGNCTIRLKVLRFIDPTRASGDYLVEETHHILGMINDFMTGTFDSKVEYVEETITEGSQTMRILNSIGDDFDLLLVGRRHNIHSNILLGLTEWCENDELGVVGDILASSDFRSKASVMVIQQQN